MRTLEVLQAWSSILQGRALSLSVEITKECPLCCPGCYAFDAAHLGGDPLVRYRELELLLPEIDRRGIHTQIVTSAFRVIPSVRQKFSKLAVVVSIDGLQPEHDAWRKPANYKRILETLPELGHPALHDHRADC